MKFTWNIFYSLFRQIKRIGGSKSFKVFLKILKSQKKRNIVIKMPAVWFALKRSLQCKTEQSDVHDPKNNLTKILTKKSSSSRSGCSRSIANLKDVIYGSSKRHMEKPPESGVCSPGSIGSSELLNPITHEVVLNNSTCELQVTSFGTNSQNGNGANHFGTFMGTLKPETPGPRGQLLPSSRSKVSNSAVPLRKSHSLSCRKSSSSGFGGIPIKPRADSNGNSSGLSCHKCGERFVKWESVEAHHLSKHAGKNKQFHLASTLGFY